MNTIQLATEIIAAIAPTTPTAGGCPHTRLSPFSSLFLLFISDLDLDCSNLRTALHVSKITKVILQNTRLFPHSRLKCVLTSELTPQCSCSDAYSHEKHAALLHHMVAHLLPLPLTLPTNFASHTFIIELNRFAVNTSTYTSNFSLMYVQFNIQSHFSS